MKHLKSFRLRYLMILILAASLSMSIESCSKSSGSAYGTTTTNNNNNNNTGTNAVTIQGMAFSPATLSVAVNTTVTWTNKDAMTHTVTSDDSKFIGSGNILTNGTFSYTFTAAGSYAYHCAIHPTMTGTIIVQ